MRWAALSLAAVTLMTGLAGCSDDGDGAASPTTAEATAETTAAPGSSNTTTTAVERPEGPAAVVAGPIEGGRGIALVSASKVDLAPADYTEAEYMVSGTASAYTAVGDLPADGRFELEPSTSADYATRVVVRRPAEADDFDGTVVVEWLNVSSGADAAPDFTYMADEILRQGHAWVGVSAQRIGIEGGPVAVQAPGAELMGAGKGLRAFDTDRYAALKHPGDAYSYDIYTQVGRALRAPGAVNPLDGLDVERLVAVGESQSAFALTTYANGVQPLTDEFDAFLIHSRGGAAAPLGEPDAGIDIAGTIGGTATQVRDDLDVPVIIVETETDVLGILNYLPARQPDSENIRLWEIAGTAHADKFQLGAVAPALGCPTDVNSGQQAYVLRSALRHLVDWSSGGEAPPEAERLAIDTAATPPAFVVDQIGNVEGGVRTPAVDAAVNVLSGLPGAGASVICILMGQTLPADPALLATRYASPDNYIQAYTASANEAIDAGFILGDDLEQVLSEADPTRITG